MADERISFGRLLVYMAVVIVIGTPMVVYLWDVLNDVLTGHFDPVRTAIAVPVLLIFLGFLFVLARQVQNWEERHVD